MNALRSFLRKPAIPVFLLLVLAPVLFFGHDGPWLGLGDISIRGLTGLPRKFTPSWFKDFDGWFADRVGLRFPLIYAGTELRVGLLRRPLHRAVFFGRDGWLYWTDDEEKPAVMADSRGRLRFSGEETRRIDASLQTVQRAFRACGLPVVIAVIPNKQNVYPEHLLGQGFEPPPNRFETLAQGLGEAKSLLLYPRAALQDAKRKEAPLLLYPKTETHWNDLGAYYGYVEIMRALERSLPIANRDFLDANRYLVTSRPFAGGDIAVRALFSPWRFPDELVLLQPKDPPQGREFGPFEAPLSRLVRNPNGSGRLLVLGDSFGPSLLPFLSLHFREVYFLIGDHFEGDLIARLKPDAVILEMVERFTTRLLRPARLERMCS